MNFIEKDGNTELYYQDDTIYAKHNGYTLKLTGASYAQAKTNPDETGWIPIAAETDIENNRVVMTWGHRYDWKNTTNYQAPTFSSKTGLLNGGYLRSGAWADLETLASINPDVMYDCNIQLQTWAECNSPGAEGEFLSTFDYVINPGTKNTGLDDNNDPTKQYKLDTPAKFNKKSAEKITNFNPSTDTLGIDTDSFGLDSSANFTSGKNKKAVKKKLINQEFDFLYDEKKGGLYFNENGSDKGFGDGGIFAILKGAPDLTSDNLEFI